MFLKQLWQNFYIDVVLPGKQATEFLIKHFTDIVWTFLKFTSLVAKLGSVLLLRTFCNICRTKNVFIQIWTLTTLKVLLLSKRLLFSNQETQSEDPLAISPLAIVRPQSQNKTYIFTLENSVNVSYSLNITQKDAKEISLFIVSAYDVVTGLAQTLEPSQNENSAVLYLPATINSDSFTKISPRQLVRIHLASVYNFVQILKSFNFSSVNVSHDVHGYSSIFSALRETEYFPSLFREYNMPIEEVGWSFELRKYKLMGYSLNENLVDSIDSAMYELIPGIAPLVLQDFSFLDMYNIVSNNKSVLVIGQIENILVRKPLNGVFDQIKSFCGYSQVERRAKPLTAEFYTPESLLVPNLEQEYEELEVYTNEKDQRGGIFSIGSFTSWLKPTSSADHNFESTLAANNLFTVPEYRNTK